MVGRNTYLQIQNINFSTFAIFVTLWLTIKLALKKFTIDKVAFSMYVLYMYS